jgi:hypothetical protein
MIFPSAVIQDKIPPQPEDATNSPFDSAIGNPPQQVLQTYRHHRATPECSGHMMIWGPRRFASKKQLRATSYASFQLYPSGERSPIVKALTPGSPRSEYHPSNADCPVDRSNSVSVRSTKSSGNWQSRVALPPRSQFMTLSPSMQKNSRSTMQSMTGSVAEGHGNRHFRASSRSLPRLRMVPDFAMRCWSTGPTSSFSISGSRR